MADTKLIGEDDTSATFETGQGEQVNVPKDSPWYETLLNGAKKMIAGASSGVFATPAQSAPEQDEQQAIAAGPTLPAWDADAGRAVPPGPAIDPSLVGPPDGQGTPPPVAEPAVTPMPTTPPVVTLSATKDSKTTTATETRPEDVKKLEEDKKKLDKVVQSGVDAKIAANTADAIAFGNEAARQQEESDRIALLKADEDRQVAARMKDVDKTITELNSMKVDPNRLYGDMSTGNKIASSISLMLGAFGAGSNGQSNMALDVLNKAIDRDIDAQKANIETKKGVVTAKRGAYDDFLKMLGNKDAARLAEQIRLSKIAEQRLQSLRSMTNNPVVQAAADQNLAQLQYDQSQKMLDLNKIVTTSVKERQTEDKPIISAESKPAALAPNPVLEQATTKSNYIRSLQELRDLTRGLKKTGPFEGRWIELKDAFGIANASEGVMRQKIMSALMDKVKANSGSAATDAERQAYASFMASLKDSPETFNAKLGSELDKSEKEYDALYDQYEGIAQMPRRTVKTSRDTANKDKRLGTQE